MSWRPSKMATKVIIFGVGGNCIDILDSLYALNEARGTTAYECVGFLDDAEANWGRSIHGVEVLGALTNAKDHSDCMFINGIGSPSNFWRKSSIIARCGVSLDRFETIVHPSASVSRMSSLGRGVVVFQNVTIASNVTVGHHVTILPNSVLSHDVVIGNYTCIAGGTCISGGVLVGHSCYLGTNCSVVGNIRIGDYCQIGMGSVVLNNVPDKNVMVGNPAHFLKTIEAELDPLIRTDTSRTQ